MTTGRINQVTIFVSAGPPPWTNERTRSNSGLRDPHLHRGGGNGRICHRRSPPGPKKGAQGITSSSGRGPEWRLRTHIHERAMDQNQPRTSSGTASTQRTMPFGTDTATDWPHRGPSSTEGHKWPLTSRTSPQMIQLDFLARGHRIHQSSLEFGRLTAPNTSWEGQDSPAWLWGNWAPATARTDGEANYRFSLGLGPSGSSSSSIKHKVDPHMHASPGSAPWSRFPHMYVGVLFLSEFPGLRPTVIWAQTWPVKCRNCTHTVIPRHLQTRNSHSSDPFEFNKGTWGVTTLDGGRVTLQISEGWYTHMSHISQKVCGHSSDIWRVSGIDPLCMGPLPVPSTHRDDPNMTKPSHIFRSCGRPLFRYLKSDGGRPTLIQSLLYWVKPGQEPLCWRVRMGHLAAPPLFRYLRSVFERCDLKSGHVLFGNVYVCRPLFR